MLVCFVVAGWMLFFHHNVFLVFVKGITTFVSYLVRENQKLWQCVDERHAQERDTKWIQLDVRNISALVATILTTLLFLFFGNTTTILAVVFNALSSSLAASARTPTTLPIASFSHFFAVSTVIAVLYSKTRCNCAVADVWDAVNPSAILPSGVSRFYDAVVQVARRF